MFMEIVVGLKGKAEAVVDDSNTAEAACSGALRVFGTPFMIALMEKAAWSSLQQALEPGKGSVGTRIDVAHTSATPVGMKVYAESVVTAVEGRKVTFRVTAYDEAGEIGSGEHERVIIDNDRFMERTYSKLKKE
jgi:predicted thioesterase